MSVDKETGRLLSRVCHDLRTPARAVRMHAELLLRDWGTASEADVNQRLGFVVDGSQRMMELLNGLSHYAAALEMDARGFQTARTDALLRAVIAKLDKEILKAEALVTRDQLPDVHGDADRLLQLFEELLRNALVHRGAAPPRIHVSAARDGESWRFAVHDDGSGVEADELERVFRPFERLHGAGAGLGLATCRAIVEGHGGKIWMESPAGGGCTVYFTIPE